MKSKLMLAMAVWVVSSVSILAQTGGFGGALPAVGTVTGIDRNKLTMSLLTDKGEEDTFVVSAAVRTFSQLKTGDTLKVTYFESLVYSIVKPGDRPDPAAVNAALARAKDVRPSGSVVTHETMTVTVKSINAAAPSVTVTTPAGKTITRKVQDKNAIAGLKAGDRIEIAYTQAMLATAEKQQQKEMK